MADVDRPDAKGRYFQIVATCRLLRKTGRGGYLQILQRLKDMVM